MNGFSIYAHDSGNFVWFNRSWTEGDIWLAKAALHVQHNPSADAIDLIEDQFKNIKNALLKGIAHLGMDLTLLVTGDFNFIYQFQAGKMGRPVALELLHLISQQEEEMGDVVMMYFCKCLIDYQLYAVV